MSVNYQVMVNHHEDGVVDIEIVDSIKDQDVRETVAKVLRDLATRIEYGEMRAITIQ